MDVAEIRTKMHQKIDSIDPDQLKQIYGLVNNYISGTGTEDWDALTEMQKAHLLKGLEQADAGLGNSLSDVNKRLKNKYGLNG